VHTAAVFLPPRRLGFLFHIVLILLLSGAGFSGLWLATQAQAGAMFLVFLLPALLAVSLVPFLLYRLYALSGSVYILERDGIRLRWGLRYEEIPMDQVLWALPAHDLQDPLPLPFLRWPGNLVGMRRFPDGTLLEFLASQIDPLILIATPGHIYAISPRDEKAFLYTYQRLTELGSLSPIKPRSVHPAFLLAQSWSDLPARFLMLGGMLFSLALLIWVSLVIPGHPQIVLRIESGGAALEYQPGVQLMLLPVLNGLFFFCDFLLGLFYYRRSANKLLAYLMWSTGLLTPLLFMGAVAFILRAS
jgi:hypothetical protein